MENYIFKPNASAFLILLFPTLVFAILIYQLPNLHLFIFFLLALFFAAFMSNRKINKLCITEDAIVFLPFWGQKVINKIYFSDIKNIKLINTYFTLNIIKNDENHISIPLKSYNSHLNIIDIIKTKSNTDVIETIITQGINYIGLSASLIYLSFDLINRLLITTEHNSPFITKLIIFCVILIVCTYIGFKATHKDTIHNKGIILSFCAILAASCTYAITVCCYLYNESYPTSTHYVELKLNKKDGNYQTWQLSDETKNILMINQERLSTHIKSQQLPKNVTLTQDSNYQATIQTGLLGDVFIIANTIKPVN